MVDSEKITGAAASAAGRAGEVAGQVKDKLSGAIGKAVPVAGDLATKAANVTAQGVDAAAGTVKGLTGGKGSSKIDAVSSKIRDVLPTSG